MTNDSEFLAEVKSRAEAAGLHALPGVAFSICSLDVPRLLAMIESRDEKLRVAVRLAREDEREACAQTADRLSLGFHSPSEYSENVGDAIRARSGEK